MTHKFREEGLELLLATLEAAKVQQSSLGELASAGAGLLIASLRAMPLEARAPYLQALNTASLDNARGGAVEGERPDRLN
jgi:hypothetical protein